jgi:Raf kinase inhibitor-like YbhB/YbcL family protein
MPFTLTSDAFLDGEPIPREYTCDGEDRSPPLIWSGAPEETRSYVLIMDDPDAPRGPFVHWMLFDIPFTTTRFPAGLPPGGGGRTLVNDFGKPAYGGPCPPRGRGPHRYRFFLYALNTPALKLYGGKRSEVEEAVAAHTLAQATLTGRYERR